MGHALYSAGAAKVAVKSVRADWEITKSLGLTVVPSRLMKVDDGFESVKEEHQVGTCTHEIHAFETHALDCTVLEVHSAAPGSDVVLYIATNPKS